MTIRVTKPGLCTIVTDMGRFGFAHLGISPCGAADPLSFRIANLLVGNSGNTPAFEMTLLGAAFEFEQSAVVAITGAACNCKVGSYRVPANTAVEVPSGGILHCGSCLNGARTYLAVRGGIQVPMIMGSASTDLRGGFGGFKGRALSAGDLISAGRLKASSRRYLQRGAVERLRAGGSIRVTRGAQADWFSDETYARFAESTYTVTEQADRAGLRLSGDPVVPRDMRQLLTDGIPLGAIQVPNDGLPIVLFVDQQTTGGYPKIANVISADMHRVGQLRPRDEVRFVEVSFPEAVAALRTQQEWFEGIWRE